MIPYTSDLDMRLKWLLYLIRIDRGDDHLLKKNKKQRKRGKEKSDFLTILITPQRDFYLFLNLLLLIT